MIPVGTKVLGARISKGLTQEELAKKLGYKSKSSINKIEMGKAMIPTDKIELFAKALDVAPAYLMGFTDDPNYIIHESSIEDDELIQELQIIFIQLNDDGRKKIIEYARDLLASNKYIF